MDVHQRVKDFACTICPFKARDKHRIQEHVKAVHDMIRDYKCDLCDYATSKKSSYELYLKRIHLRVKGEKCEACDFSASSKKDIRSHVKSAHMNNLFGEKYPCKDCDYVANQRVNLECSSYVGGTGGPKMH